VKHIDHLGQQGNARIERDRLASQALRPALAIEMFVEAVDAGRHAFRKAQQAGDFGAALATGGDQFLGDILAIAKNAQHAAETLGQRCFQAGMAEYETKHLRQAVADRLEIALETEVVGQVQLADARRIAAAAQILEQQRVVQVPQVVIVEAQAAPDVHADPAAAHAMAFRLALGDVERVAERRNQFGQLKPGGRRNGVGAE